MHPIETADIRTLFLGRIVGWANLCISRKNPFATGTCQLHGRTITCQTATGENQPFSGASATLLTYYVILDYAGI